MSTPGKPHSIGMINPANNCHMNAKQTVEYILSGEDPIERCKEVREYIISNSDRAPLTSSRLAYVRKVLREKDANREIINAAKCPEITILANEASADPYRTRIEASEGDENDIPDGVDIPEHFKIMPFIQRLNKIDTDQDPTMTNVIDVMILVCSRPTELLKLEVDGNYKTSGFAKARDDREPRTLLTCIDNDRALELLDWIQTKLPSSNIPSPCDPVGLGKYREALRPFKIQVKALRVIGAEHAAYCNTVDKEITTEREITALKRIALRHKKNIMSPTEFYTTVNRPLPPDYIQYFHYLQYSV